MNAIADSLTQARLTDDADIEPEQVSYPRHLHFVVD